MRVGETRRSTLAAVAITATLALGCSATAGVTPVREVDVDAKAGESLERMSAFLGKAKALSVTLDIGYDIMQAWGQKIEFGETRVLTVRRPDRLRVDTTGRDGSRSGVVFDGSQIAVFDIDDDVYATTPQPGDLDDAIAHFIDDLGMHLPMATLAQGRLAKEAPDWVNEIHYVETATIAGVPCDHVALNGDWEDVQIWIARGERPLPQRIVITYTRAEGQPQFRAQFSEWNLAPRIGDDVFAFTPPEGAAKIPFRPRGLTSQAPGGSAP